MDLLNSGRKLTDEDFYNLMNSMVNKSSSFIDELSSAVSNQNPFSAFVQNVPPEARAQIMQPLEQQVEQMPEAPYTNNGTFQSLAGSAQTGGQDVYSGSDPTDYGVAGGEQVSNMDKWLAENAVGAMNLVAQPEKFASGLLDIGSGYYQQATGDITNPQQVEQANQTTQQFKDMFTAEGIHRGPDALALTAGGTYLAGQAGKLAGQKLNNPNTKAKIVEEFGSFSNKAEEMAGRIPGVETEKTVAKDIIAFHNSPHKFNEIDPNKQQEGLMGKGHYVFLNKEAADDYPGAYRYTQEIPDDIRDRVINFGDGNNSIRVDTAFNNISRNTGINFSDDFRPGNYFELIKAVGNDEAHKLLRAEGVIGNLTNIGTTSKPEAVMMYTPDDVQLLTRNGESLLKQPTESISGRFPSEMGQVNMTEAERKISNEMNSTLPYKEPDDLSGLQGLLDAASAKETRIALNEQKANAKAQAQIAKQAQFDAKDKAPIDELGFYSKAEQVILDLKQETNTPDDIKRYLQKNGVTKAELEDTGLLGMLDATKERGDRVTKTGLLSYIENNKTRLDETQYRGKSEEDAYDELLPLSLDDPQYTNSDDANFVVMENEHLDSDVEEFMYSINQGHLHHANHESIISNMYKLNTEKYPIEAGVFDVNGNIVDENIPSWYKPIHNAITEQDVDLIPNNLQNDFVDAVSEMKNDEYLENPIYEWNVNIDNENFTARGNPEVGIMIEGPDGQFINDEPVYSVSEANIEIQQNAAEYGIGFNEEGATKYSDYTQPGLNVETYREIPITTKPLSGEDYTGGHFDEDNVVGHLRVSDKVDQDGKKVLFIEELQSDWHQSGRKSGYLNKENKAKRKELKRIQDRLFDKFHSIEAEAIDKGFKARWYPTEAKLFNSDGIRIGLIKSREADPVIQWTEEAMEMPLREFDKALKLMEDFKVYNSKFYKNSKALDKINNLVSDAPLKNDKWQEMAFKRAMKIASDEGYDRVAWTNSQQQVDLYSDRYRELYENTYDKKLPGIAKKLANKTKSKTGKTDIDFDNDNSAKVNYIDVTPELKTNVNKGQSMYSAVPIIGGGLLATQQEEPKKGLLD